MKINYIIGRNYEQAYVLFGSDCQHIVHNCWGKSTIAHHFSSQLHPYPTCNRRTSYMNYLIIILISMSSFGALQADIKPGETKVVVQEFREAINLYTLFVKILSTDYIKSQNSLISNDKNFNDILKMVHYLHGNNRRNVDIDIIKPYVLSIGSEKYLNEYKGLFIFWFDLHHALTACPSEITYYINKDGRITYLEARSVLKENDKQVFDRDLLQRFIITKAKFKQRYNCDL